MESCLTLRITVVPQLRPARVAFVAIRRDLYQNFRWPEECTEPPKTVGEILYPFDGRWWLEGRKNFGKNAPMK